MSRGFRSRVTRRTPDAASSLRRSMPLWLPVVFILFLLVAFLALVDSKLRPSLARAAAAVATQAATRALNDAVSKELGVDADNRSLVTITPATRDDGLTIARFNIAAMTALQSDATDRAEAALSNLSAKRIRLPIAHVFGGSVLSISSLSVPIRLSLIGNAHSSVTVDVRSVGINQVAHILTLDIVADVSVVAPFVSEPVHVETRTPIAYVVLAGPVPNNYYPGNNGLNSTSGKTVPRG